jgi:chromosome segregation ATPase
MPVSFRNYIKLLIAACLVVSFCLVEADAQTRRKRRTRRTTQPVARPVITNPPIAPAEETPSAESSDTGDVKIISTADSTQDATSSTDAKKAKPAASPEKEEMQQTITTLTNQVNKLNDRLTSMQEDERYQVEMERLTRAEQRAEQLRGQLMDIQTKIGDYQARLEQLDWALKPENIESSTAGYGTTRPEQIREARRKGLESERSRVTTQLKLAETSRARLEGAVSNADAEVDHLRTKLQQRREQMDADAQPVEVPKPRKPE